MWYGVGICGMEWEHVAWSGNMWYGVRTCGMEWGPCLAYSMAAVLSLLVIVWVEVNIMEDNNVGSSQVDPKTTWNGMRHTQQYIIIPCISRGVEN